LNIKTYGPGTSVLIGDEISAKIVTVAVHSGNYIRYECVWWSGSTRTSDWFGADEISGVDDKDKNLKIGFSQGS